MDTAVWILIIALVLVFLAAAGFFLYKYYLEPHHVLENLMNYNSHNSHNLHHSHNNEPQASSSMAGHIIGKMKKAKAYSNKAIHKIKEAKAHLNKAQHHATHS